LRGLQGIHRSGRRVGGAPDGCLKPHGSAVRFTEYRKPSVRTFTRVASVEDGKSNAAHPNFWREVRSVRSQCHQTQNQRTSFRKSTTERCPRSSVDRPERLAICPRLPTLQRGSRQRTLLAILKQSPPGREFKPRGSCSRTYSAECAESRSISDSPSPDHWGVGAFEARTHVITNVVDHDLRQSSGDFFHSQRVGELVIACRSRRPRRKPPEVQVLTNSVRRVQGLPRITLVDLIEMLADWKAATERHDDGDLAGQNLAPEPDCRSLTSSPPSLWPSLEQASKQRAILEAVVRHPYVAVKSAYDTGKSHGASRAVAWWLDTKEDPFATTTAPTTKQVHAILWRYIGQAHLKGNLPGRITLDDEWYMGPGGKSWSPWPQAG
jgi:hypothetical protein